MTQTEGAFFISVNDTSPIRDFSASRIRTRTLFVIPVTVRSVLAKYGEVRAFNRINEDKESSTQASLSSFIVCLPLYFLGVASSAFSLTPQCSDVTRYRN